MSRPQTPDKTRSMRTRSMSRASVSSVGSDVLEDPNVAVDNPVVAQELVTVGQENPGAEAIQVQADVNPTPEEKEKDEKKTRKKDSNSVPRSRTSTVGSKKSSSSKKEDTKQDLSKKEELKKDMSGKEEASGKEETSKKEKKKKSKKKKTPVTSDAYSTTDGDLSRRTSDSSDSEDEDKKKRRRRKKKKSHKKSETSGVSETSEDEEKKAEPKKEKKEGDEKKEGNEKKEEDEKKKKKDEDTADEWDYLAKDPEYSHLPDSAEMEILRLMNQIFILVQKSLDDKVMDSKRKRKKYQLRAKQLNNSLPAKMSAYKRKAQEEAEKKIEKQMGKSFAGKFYEDMVVRSQTMKDDVQLDFSNYKKTKAEREKDERYSKGWDMHRERGKPDKETYITHYNIVKDRFGARKLVIEEPLPMRNFLVHLKDATVENKLAPSQVISLCQLCLSDRTMMCFRVLMKQGHNQLQDYPGEIMPHPVAYAVSRLSRMLPTQHMIVVDMMEDFWSMDLSLHKFLPDKINTTIATLSQLALLAYEGRPQKELDEIIKTKVALSIPKEVRLLVFQHEAARLANGDKMLSETELYEFMRFLAGRGSKGGFKPDPRRVRRPEPLDSAHHGILKTFAVARKVDYQDVIDEVAMVDPNDCWSACQVPEPAPAPAPAQDAQMDSMLALWARQQEEILLKQADILSNLPINRVAQTLIDQLQERPHSQTVPPTNVVAATSLEFEDRHTPMLEYAPSSAMVAATSAEPAREQTKTSSQKKGAAESKFDVKPPRNGKYITRSDNSWDVYHKMFKDQNQYRESNGYKRFWEDQVSKVGLTPWWPEVTSPCPKDRQNRYVSEMNRYPRDKPILYKTGERVMIAKTYLLHYADHQASFCCGRTTCSMISCPPTGDQHILHYCDTCEIGFHSSTCCRMVSKSEADIPRN